MKDVLDKYILNPTFYIPFFILVIIFLSFKDNSKAQSACIEWCNQNSESDVFDECLKECLNNSY